MNTNSSILKELIEDRYNRLKNNKRRPSLEYVSPQEIKDTFLPYISDKESFNKLSDKELLDFYQRWYEQHTKVKEVLDLPDLNN